MPRNGSGVASAVPGFNSVAASTTILSALHNSGINDLISMFNTAWPTSLGGTGGTSVITSWDALTAEGSVVPSASTLVLTTATGPRIDISGTTAVTAVTLANGAMRIARATGAFTLTAGASLKVNGSTTLNYTTSVGDLLFFQAEAGVVSVYVISRGVPAAPQRNRITNPAMQVSQENGNTAGTTNLYYGADQFTTSFVTSAGTFTTQRVQSVTPNGSKDRYRVTITVADASLAAGEYLTIATKIEGQEVADLQWGAAAALQTVLRFGFKAPAGTYAVSLTNSATNRSYVGLFTISAGQANTDTLQTIAVPGDTSGTWLKDNGTGILIEFTLACGSTFQGTTGWQAGNIFGTSAVSNGMGTGAAVFELFDVGFYADPNVSGAAPAWEIPDFADEERRCLRYYEKATGQINCNKVASAFQYLHYPWKVKKRTAGPAVSTLDIASNANKYSTATTANVVTNNRAYTSISGTDTGFLLLSGNGDTDVTIILLQIVANDRM